MSQELCKYEITEYKIFPGRNIEQMSILLKGDKDGGYKPLDFYEIMDYQIKAANEGDAEEQAFWWIDNWLDSVTACTRHSNGSLKVTNHALPLMRMNSDTSLTNRAIELVDGGYQNLQGYEHTQKELEAMKLNKDLTPEEAKAHPIRFSLADGNQERLNAHVDAYVKMREAKEWSKNGLGVYVPDSPSEGAEMRLWVAGRLGDVSGADGRVILDGGSGLLVGERQRRLASGTDLVQVSLTDVIKFMEEQKSREQ